MTESEQKSLNQPQPKNTRSGILLATLSLIIAIIAIVIAGFAYQQLMATKSQTDTAAQSSTLTQKKLEERVNNFQKEISAEQQKNKTNLSQLLQQTSNIPAQQAQSQAKYLAHLAALNLHYRGDINTAKEQLQLALQQLQDFHTPQAESLKEKIGHTLDSLSNIKSIDQQSILSSLDKLIDEVKQIPILTELNPSQPTTPATNVQKNWWGNVKQNLGKFKSFVTVKHIDNPNAYAFTPEEKMLAKQLMLIKLTQAEWAVINLDQGVYQQSLSAAQKMLNTIALPADKKETLLNQVNSLQKISLTNKIDLTASSNTTKPSPHSTTPTQGTR